ncbi:MAG: hypothetical protein ACFFB5_03950 [Promethearchaeota archaeon]
MSKKYEFQALIATRPTLKWFILIGIGIMIIGLFIIMFISPFIGYLVLWAGIIIVTLSLIALLFLWFSDRILPQPKY